MTDARPTALVVRQNPRRTRLRFVDRRGDDTFLARLAEQLSTLPGVTHVRPYPLTGSLLILHDVSADGILHRARDAELLTIGKDEAASPPQPDLNSTRISTPLAIAAVLAAFAVWQLLRGRVLPPAVTLAWYAATLALPLLPDPTKKE